MSTRCYGGGGTVGSGGTGSLMVRSTPYRSHTTKYASVVAVSPIVAGAALKGPADRMLIELGHEASVVGVARLYRDVAATLVIDTADTELAHAVEDTGMNCVVTDTIMREPGVAAALAAQVLEGVPG